MPVRFTLAVIFAVLVAASRPEATGGEHDILAVGVRVEETRGGKSVSRVSIGMPEEKALRAYEAILRSPSREDLLKKTVVCVARPAGTDPRIAELIYYGRRSRAGRASVVFTSEPGAPAGGAAEAMEAAHFLAELPDAVTAAAARIVVRETPDDIAFREALEALAAVHSETASAEAKAAALDRTLSANRRMVAVRVLRSLGGARIHPETFRRLAEDPDALVSEAAK